MEGTNLSLVWPAAGVAAVWLWARHGSGRLWLDGTLLVAIAVVVNLATGAPAGTSVTFALANLVQAVIFTKLVARWRPALVSEERGCELVRTSELWILLGAGTLSTVCGAAIGPLGVWLSTGTYSWAATVVWLTRGGASVLVIGAVGLRLLYLHRCRRAGRASAAAHPGAVTGVDHRPPLLLAEYLGVLVCSVVAYWVAFALADALPLAFSLLAVTVWAALRLSTTFVVLHGLAAATVTVVFTVHGIGPFASIGDHTTGVLVAQLFVIMIAVVGLTLALGRDERTALIRELERGKVEAARQAELMSAIVHSMADGVSVIDEDGHVVLRNPAAEELLGGRVSPGDVTTDASYYGVFHLDGTPLVTEDLPHVRALAEDRALEMDVLVRNAGIPQGRLLHVSATVLAHGSDMRSAVLLFHDVTAERRQRDELASFAGVVAHDLLNPLATIEGWTEIAAQTIAEQPPDPVLDTISSSLTRVRRAGNRMRALINDLLAYATAREATLAPVVVDLGRVVADIATARVDAAVATKALIPTFHIGTLPSVEADPVLIRQLLDNIIGNAIKYSIPAVPPRITVECVRDGETVEISVVDNGIGIPPGQHEKIFGDFHRAHNGVDYSGTGLGLAICKRIAERHQGTVVA
ncbi:ATP-binding protein, partial [Actinophytocola xanthii]